MTCTGKFLGDWLVATEHRVWDPAAMPPGCFTTQGRESPGHRIVGTEMIVYLNGKYVDASEAVVSVWDGGFLYGDGIYTTLRLYGGRPLDLAAHYRRLKSHAAAMDLPLPLTEPDFLGIALELAGANDLATVDGRMRITVSRGGGPDNPLPVSGLEAIEPTVLVTLTAIGAELDRWRDEGIPVITLDASFARGNFPELKTLNSLATIVALRRAAAAGCPEAILTDERGCLLEGAISNLFLVSAGNLLTPVCTGGFLPGRTRERILDIAAREGITVREEPLDRRHLAAASEVFMASSVREVLPVISIDGEPVDNGSPGEMTLLIQDRYRRAILAGD
jgi:branched-subunit amino acid aminotransferase/4-amino-4-deoxychorismate lyase